MTTAAETTGIEIDPPHPRRYQFSLRTLLLAVFATAACFGLYRWSELTALAILVLAVGAWQIVGGLCSRKYGRFAIGVLLVDLALLAGPSLGTVAWSGLSPVPFLVHVEDGDGAPIAGAVVVLSNGNTSFTPVETSARGIAALVGIFHTIGGEGYLARSTSVEILDERLKVMADGYDLLDRKLSELDSSDWKLGENPHEITVRMGRGRARGKTRAPLPTDSAI
jgi:hypothetical protein